MRLKRAREAPASPSLHESPRRALPELLELWVQSVLDLLFHLPFPFASFPTPLPVRSWLLLPWNMLFQFDLVAYGTLLSPALGEGEVACCAVGVLSFGVAGKIGSALQLVRQIEQEACVTSQLSAHAL